MILDNIQTFYSDPRLVVAALDVLTKRAQVPGVFPLLEEAGVVEGIIQYILEHQYDQGVQYAGLKGLSAVMMMIRMMMRMDIIVMVYHIINMIIMWMMQKRINNK